jgi:RNA polymerase sigma-70 factor (ECF subfamily)
MRYWLFRVAYHRAISALRRRRLIRWESLEESHEREPEAFSAALTFENDIAEREALRAALERLAPQDVACLFLRLVQGFTPGEIGQILGASSGQVSKRLARAKQHLRSIYLAQEGKLEHTTSQKGAPS